MRVELTFQKHWPGAASDTTWGVSWPLSVLQPVCFCWSVLCSSFLADLLSWNWPLQAQVVVVYFHALLACAPAVASICQWQISKWGMVEPAHLFKPNINRKLQVPGHPKNQLPHDRGGKQGKAWPFPSAQMRLPLYLECGMGQAPEARIATKALLYHIYLKCISLKLLSCVSAIISVIKSSWLLILQGSSDLGKWSLKSHDLKK